MLDAWSRSAVIHKSLDESAATDADQEVDEGEEEEEQQQGDNNAQGQDDPDRILHNCREARPEDGLLSVEELQSLYTSLRPEGGVSLYDASAIPGEEENTFGTRWQEQAGWERPSVDAPGVAEPCYTNVTPLWRCTLDYIVVYPTEKQHQSEVKPTGLLKMPRLQELEWVGLSVERNPS